MNISQILVAKNGPNGNPQRVTTVRDGLTGELLEVQDHGYRGPQIPQGSVFIGTVNISRSDYHAIIRQAKSDGILNIH